MLKRPSGPVILSLSAFMLLKRRKQLKRTHTLRDVRSESMDATCILILDVTYGCYFVLEVIIVRLDARVNALGPSGTAT